MEIYEQILSSRKLSANNLDKFINPIYDENHDPFLLPDMEKAIKRLLIAHRNKEKIFIYGDYDIDGLTASTLLLDALESFGYKDVEVFIPNRFSEGYGLTVDAIKEIASKGANLIVTVDCGSLSYEPVGVANRLGVDVIITDHHNVNELLPEAVAVINPKRKEHNYPFIDLPGVGVAFKLVQALQTKLKGLENGQEKWLLDLVALGTICDVVSLVDENRTHVYWGLKVLQKSRRVGLVELMKIASVNKDNLKTRDVGFALGPRMNASGRLETAMHSLDLLRAKNKVQARDKAELLDEMNSRRRQNQDVIYEQALIQAEGQSDSKVLVVSDPSWNHGIVGIVAAKLVELYKKPVFVLQVMGDESKGSARSFGDFSVADAVRSADDLIIKGGGHKMAAGVTLLSDKIPEFRQRVNHYYDSLSLSGQEKFLVPASDGKVDCLKSIDLELTDLISSLEPFGNGNPEPVITIQNVRVANSREMGSNQQHTKITIVDEHEHALDLIRFNTPPEYRVNIGDSINIWFSVEVNEWNNNKRVEGRLLHLEKNFQT